MDKKLFRVPLGERAQMFERIACELAKQPDVSFAYLLGSSLSESAFHDIDVAVYLTHPANSSVDRDLQMADHLTRAVQIPVDVRPLNDAPLAFVFHALRGRLLFSRDDERLASVIEDTVPRYLDMEPIVRRALQEAFGL